jgi:hypothetical protein
LELCRKTNKQPHIGPPCRALHTSRQTSCNRPAPHWRCGILSSKSWLESCQHSFHGMMTLWDPTWTVLSCNCRQKGTPIYVVTPLGTKISSSQDHLQFQGCHLVFGGKDLRQIGRFACCMQPVVCLFVQPWRLWTGLLSALWPPRIESCSLCESSCFHHMQIA